MDIIDIMLAKAMTPQGKTEAYVAKANKAAARAARAEHDAASAIASVTAAAETIAAAQEDAADLLAAAQEALETAESAQINVPVLYTTTGQNEDGTMTQKAITDALADKADSSALAQKADVSALAQKADISALAQKADISDLNNKANISDLATKVDASALTNYATKTYVDTAIANVPSGGSSGSNQPSNLDSENAGKIVIIGEDGTITAGDTTEDDIVEALLRAGVYTARDAVGLDIDYQGKSFTRTQEAENLSMGSDFDSYVMYGGRMRCNVADDGTINAFYGDNNYIEDGSNGQVMVYQPKFYYQRTPLKVEDLTKGQIVRRDSIIISPEKQAGFKLHPIFEDGENGELDYVLFSAYDGSLINNILSSIAGVQPASAMTITAAESYATARGAGWHIFNMAAESANQMLQLVEYGTMNGQTALEAGVSDLPSVTTNVNCSALTGSTSSLGNATGHAIKTINNNNGTLVENTTAGARAISYRGIENPWGNLWNFVGGINIKGDGVSDGGAPYICKNFNYTPDTISSNYEYIGFNLPNIYGWISAMGYGNKKYDWVLMPAECASTGNSLLPVGDNLWTISHVNGNKIVVVGGSYSFKENNGMFYYGCDNNASILASNYGARLMYIPTKGSIYNNNIEKWTAKMGE